MDIEQSAPLSESGIPVERLLQKVPSAFAERPYAHVSPNYVFISTAQLITALTNAGFRAVQAREARSRGERAGFGKHMLRFRHENHHSLTIVDAVPELVVVNAHDRTSSYQLRAGIFRPLCENGMLARIADWGLIHVPHRGNVIANVVEAAMSILDGFSCVGPVLEQMARTILTEEQKIHFAHNAALLRYPQGTHIPYPPHHLLNTRRAIDQGDDVWHVYNVVQENIMRGRIQGRTITGRVTQTRPIGAIRADMKINNDLWQLAMGLIRG